LWRNPGFTAVALLLLAIGIGATTSIFSVVNSVLLKPLPYPDSQALLRIVHAIGGIEQPYFSDAIYLAYLENTNVPGCGRLESRRNGRHYRTRHAGGSSRVESEPRHSDDARCSAGDREMVLAGRRHVGIAGHSHSHERLLVATVRWRH
jgi:hypothetical protein